MADEKKNWLGPYIPEGNVLREVVQQVKLVYHLMLDSRVHPLAKLIPIAAVAYVLSPVDLVADVVPFLGQLDDAAIVMMGVRLFFEVSPPEVVREYLKRFVRPAAEDEWKVVPPADAEPAAPAEPSQPEVVEGRFTPTDETPNPPPAS